MAEAAADLMHDPNDVGPDCLVRCRISSGPRENDTDFNPEIGDRVVLIDDDGQRLRGRVTDRDGDSVLVQVELAGGFSRSA